MKSRSYKELAYILEYARTRFAAYDRSLRGEEGCKAKIQGLKISPSQDVDIDYGVQKIRIIAEMIKSYGIDDFIEDAKTKGAKRGLIRRVKKEGWLT